MAAKQLRGVGGVLGNLLTPPELASSPVHVESPPPAAPQSPEPAEAAPEPEPASKPARDTKRKARLGRPPASGKAVEREKVSLRIRADLAAAYRDWSWEEHCQFSDLVDRALESYLKNRRKARMPERE